MDIKLACREYGFDCDFVASGEKSLTTLEKMRGHFEEEHGIEYSPEVVIQMVLNKGHARESILDR